MNGVAGLAQEIRKCVEKRIEHEARAQRGVVKNGLFHSNAGSYVVSQAVELNPNLKVWAVRSRYGAVVVGQ